MLTLRTLTLGAFAALLASCASDATSVFCPTTGIVCPEGTVCAAAQPVCLATSCGNGVSDPGEQCDDGNIIDGDRCSALCRVEECGNNVIDQSAGEECDDNNDIGGDGCSAQCRRESCGNGVTDVGEECDDGNLDNQDGCTGTPIEISDGMGGTMRSPEPCMSREICGNGIKDFQVGEVCDDGNTASGDGCNSDCRSGEGCGNGIVDPGEECDDGDNDDHDRCRNNCKVAVCGDGIVESTGNREACDGGNEANPAPVETADCNIDCTSAVCGDGKVNVHTVPSEQCDKGAGQNGNNRDCRSDCQNNICTDGFQNTEGPLHVEACDDGDQDNFNLCNNACQSATCGNMTIENGEMCDDGNLDDTDACIACTNAKCGDGHLQDTVEQCDDGDTLNGTNNCSSTCRIEGCGNGILDPGEECDDNEVPSPIPSAAVNQNACVGQCKIARCGDGFLRTDMSSTEQCDDGDNDSGDGCSATCRNEGCGNGQIDPGEQCDGGENPPIGGDGCDVNCQLEDCGDGFVDVGEQCDGNGAGVGGQTAGCNIDCTFAACDDLKINTAAGEQCDDGPILNANDHDCRNDCKLNICTDGFRNDFGPLHIEGCDDGNQNNNDTCSNSCTSASCGNGTVNPGEECDDGNAVETDACTNICKLNVCGDGKVRAGVEECDTTPGTVGAFTYNCSPAAGASPSAPGCRLQRCGNGVIDPGETCDDDLTAAGTSAAGQIAASFSLDGCDNQCHVEFCGDGIENNIVGGTPTEECDGDGSGTPGETVNCNINCTDSACGDGVLNVLDGEQCDDGCGGNGCSVADNGDGCTSLCKFERCGNNIVDAGEQCDKGLAGDATCYGSSDPRGCLSIACNNGRIDTGETCEPPNTRGCSAACQTILFCGDGVVTAGETCDPPNTTTCNFDCTLSGCGDSKVNVNALPSEVCDPGGGSGTPTQTAACDNDCTPNVCGDTHIGTNEDCDAGTAGNGYGKNCLPNCENNVCGDGFVDGEGVGAPNTEACDDGNVMMETSANCTGYNTSCLFCSSDCDTPLTFTGPFCGDGTMNGPETCDDMGATNSTNACAYSITNTPNTCTACHGCTTANLTGPYCGDGAVSNGEACDPPNVLPTSTTTGCSATCTTVPRLAACGNGIIDAGETCEPPSTNVCDSSCHVAFCGDGTCGAGENATNCIFDCSCGNGVADTILGEECDMADLNGGTCASEVGAGFVGPLTCNASCDFVTTACTMCGNTVCDPGETTMNCPADCP